MQLSSTVTICIPCFNSSKTLTSTLNSIRRQSYSELRILISDNASTDQSKILLQEISAKDKRIVVYYQEKNLGYCGNISFLLGKVETEFVAIFHSDDLYHPEIISEELIAAKQFDLDLVFAQTREFYNGSRYKAWKANYRFLPADEDVTVFSEQCFLDLVLSNRNFLPTPTLLARTSAIRSLGSFQDTYPSNEDLDLWLRAFQSGFRIGIVRRYLLDYRLSSESGTTAFRKLLKMPVFFELIDNLLSRGSYSPSKEIREVYEKRKAYAALLVAVDAKNAKRWLLAAAFKKKSKEIYRFSTLSIGRLFQESLTILALYEWLKRKIKG